MRRRHAIGLAIACCPCRGCRGPLSISEPRSLSVEPPVVVRLLRSPCRVQQFSLSRYERFDVVSNQFFPLSMGIWPISAILPGSCTVALPNRRALGEAPNGFLTDEFTCLSVMHSICGQFATHSLSDKILPLWRFTSFFGRFTMPFSSFEYGMLLWCRIPESVANPSKVLFMNWVP